MTEAIALKVELILVPKQLSSLIKFMFLSHVCQL